MCVHVCVCNQGDKLYVVTQVMEYVDIWNPGLPVSMGTYIPFTLGRKFESVWTGSISLVV